MRGELAFLDLHSASWSIIRTLSRCLYPLRARRPDNEEPLFSAHGAIEIRDAPANVLTHGIGRVMIGGAA